MFFCCYCFSSKCTINNLSICQFKHSSTKLAVGSSYPFTIYQSATPSYRGNNIQQRQNRLQETDLKTIRGIYLNPITNEAEYIKIKVANSGRQLFAKAYYKAETDQWFRCNNQIVALGIYDDAELREYFNYKVNIPNVGTIYY